MANFGKLILTNAGLQEQYKAQSGTPLKFKRIGMGSGEYSGSIANLTKLVQERVSVVITKGYMQNNAFVVEGLFSNESLQMGFAWREIGVFVEDSSGNEVLYCYANAGNSYDYIPATDDERYSKYIRVLTAIGNASNISIVENEGFIYVDSRAFNAAVEEFRTDIDQLWPSKQAAGEAIFIKDSSNLPLLGMNIFGKSTQDGTPTPDAPVDIESVGDDGSVDVLVAGKNLYNCRDVVRNYNVGEISDDDFITIVCDNTSGSSRVYKDQWTNSIKHLKHNTDYRLVVEVKEMSNCILYAISIKTPSEPNSQFVNNVSITDVGTFNKIVRTNNNEWDDSIRLLRTFAQFEPGASGKCVFRISLQEVENENIDYEPYKGQTLAISTPNGLRGIPVASGGNYTDSNGQEWICDEIDLARGVYIQRIFSRQILSSYNWASMATEGRYWLIEDDFYNINNSAFCTHFKKTDSWVDYTLTDGTFIIHRDSSWADGRLSFKYSPYSSLADWKSFLDNNEVYIIYELASPIETALSAEEIAAYKAITAQNPNTTVLNDGEAEMSVLYITKTFEALYKSIGGESDAKALAEQAMNVAQEANNKIKYGTTEVTDGAASPYPEGTLYIVI